MLKVSLYLFLFLSACDHIYAQNSSQQQAKALLQTIQSKHYNPKPVDDKFSQLLFDQFIESLDPERLFFTQGDINTLSQFQKSLDDELNGNSWTFLNKATPLFKQRLLQADSIITEITAKPYDFTLNEFYSEILESSWAAGEKDRKSKWYQLLKYETLDGLGDIASVQLSKNGMINKKEVLDKETQVRLMIKARHQRYIKSILQTAAGFESYVQTLYLDALANCFDPHTNFFPETEKENFESSLSKDGYYFGFALGENEKGEASIIQLYPGGPAWKTGEINQGDVLLQMKWAGKEPIDLVGADAAEVSSLLDASNNDLLDLTIKKANGQVKTVQLKKEKLKGVEEDVVKSILLNGPAKIGYISLPGFYTEWENEGGSSCANDVAKEIVKLKRENINGLILDLRFNGGGSLMEAIELAGIFIEEGPLCLVKTKEGKIITLRDPNRGTIYDGPLLVLVNGQSASASELVAAVLQDYNRAIIAGSPTYGKATSQEIFPLLAGTTVLTKEQGFAKITIGKIYRVTGNATQQKGVIPDISLPDIFEGYTYKESDYMTALINDTVKRNQYYKPLKQIPVATMGSKSGERLLNDNNFKHLARIKQMILEKNKDTAPISLKWDEFEKRLLKDDSVEMNFFDQEMSVSSYKLDNHSFDKNRMTTDETFSLINSQWLRKLNSDIYVEEAYRILLDYISIMNTKN